MAEVNLALCFVRGGDPPLTRRFGVSGFVEGVDRG